MIFRFQRIRARTNNRFCIKILPKVNKTVVNKSKNKGTIVNFSSELANYLNKIIIKRYLINANG